MTSNTKDFLAEWLDDWFDRQQVFRSTKITTKVAHKFWRSPLGIRMRTYLYGR